MNTFERRLSGLLLTLVLLVLPATAAHGEPLADSYQRWTTSLSDLLDDLLDGVLSIGAAGETGDDTDPQQLDGGALEPAPTAEPTAMDGNELSTRTGIGPSFDPAGAV